MLMTLISMFGGGLMRMLPELLAWLNKKTDYSHELAMMDKQFALEQSKAAARLTEAELAGDINMALEMTKVQGIALQSQMQKTGIKLVDALNFLVRPLTTYYLLGCYGIYKTAMLYAAYHQGDMWAAIVATYDADDRAMLAGVISFWFVGRTFEKRK